MCLQVIRFQKFLADCSVRQGHPSGGSAHSGDVSFVLKATINQIVATGTDYGALIFSLIG